MYDMSLHRASRINRNYFSFTRKIMASEPIIKFSVVHCLETTADQEFNSLITGFLRGVIHHGSITVQQQSTHGTAELEALRLYSWPRLLRARIRVYYCFNCCLEYY